MKLEKTKGINIALFILSIIAIICIITIIFLSISITSEDTKSDIQQEPKEKIIYSDDNFKVTYIDFVDPKSPITIFNLLLKIENNSDKEIIVSLIDGYANNTAVFFGAEMPTKIQPGKNAIGAFALGYANTGIKSIDEIKTLEFKIQLYNANFLEIVLETENIVINLE